MANAPVTVRLPPAGTYLKDGYQSFIALNNAPSVVLWEKSVGVIGLDGGPPIDTTTMFNETWRTSQPKALVTTTPFSCTVAYNPSGLTSILAQINILQAISIVFSDASTWSFWGFIQSFQPKPMVEGQMPEADIQIVSTNFDLNNEVVSGPAYNPA